MSNSKIRSAAQRHGVLKDEFGKVYAMSAMTTSCDGSNWHESTLKILQVVFHLVIVTKRPL